MKARSPRVLRIDLEAADLAPVASHPSDAFLGRLGLPALRQEMAEAGVLAALEARGYVAPDIRLSVESGEHRLVIAPAGGGESLLDLRMEEGALVVAEPGLRARGIEVLSVLSVHWLALQDPRAAFTPARPRLPGQAHPGLGLGRRLYVRVLDWAAAWGKDALANVPAYFHNAKFYAPPFAFLSPAEQGRFEALGRDLAPMSVAEASRAVDEERVVDTATGEVVRWRPGDMIAALSPALREYLGSEEYVRAASKARGAHRFKVR